MNSTISIAASLALTIAVAATAQRPPALEIRFSPAGHVYLAEDNRQFGIANLQIQNIAIVNAGSEPVRIEEVLIEVLAGEEVVRTERHPARILATRWSRLKGYLDLPGTMKSEDARYRFRELLGTSLRCRRRVSGTWHRNLRVSTFHVCRCGSADDRGEAHTGWASRIRVSVRGVSSAGTLVTAENYLRVIYYLPTTDTLSAQGSLVHRSFGKRTDHHRTQPVHEFALDLIQIGEGGRSHKGTLGIAFRLLRVRAERAFNR